MELFDRTQKHLKEKRENIINGSVNCIPSPFPGFKNDFIGFEQSSYITITSYSKGGKTQFTLYLLFEALMYVINNGTIDLKVFYFPLEEDDEKILLRFESFLLFKLNKIRISPRDLRSTDANKPVDPHILELLESDEYQLYINAFEKHFEFNKIGNPTGMYRLCKQYALDNGTVYTKKYKARNEFGEIEERDGAFDYYVPNNPNRYVIMVVDHCSLVNVEGGLSLKESLDRLSKYMVELRNNYGFTPIMIQQQSTENESNDSIKLKNIRPSVRGLSDSKYTGRDTNILLGLFSPFKFGLQEYYGYDISKFKDRIRFLEVCISRDGECGGLKALYFDGATCTFQELPLPIINGKPNPELEKWYKYLDKLNKNG